MAVMMSGPVSVLGPPIRLRIVCTGGAGAGTSNDTELERLKKRLQFVMYCIDCFVS
jgi:hypothetical protein